MERAFAYEVFGLRIRSEIELPELFPAKCGDAADAIIRRGKVDVAAPGLQPDGDGLLLTIPDVGRYRIVGGREIIVDADAKIPDRNVRLYLLGSAFGALLHQRGLLPLHANAVEIDGRAVAFMGPSGAGKSTLAAWFHDRGHRVIADDVCVIGFDEDGHPYACPGLPRLRLWAEALALMGRDSAGFNRSYIGDQEEKYDVPIAPELAAQANIPLAAVYVLKRADEFSIKPLGGVEAAEAVFANTYRGSYVAPTRGQQRHWQSAVGLVRTVPVYSASRAWTAGKADEQRSRLLEQVTSQLAMTFDSNSICVGCGLCCDGTLHGSATVRAGDEAAVNAAGLEIVDDGEVRAFRQPCPRFSCGSCTIYARRPEVCRHYRCALLMKLEDGSITESAAREKIEKAKELLISTRRAAPQAVTPKERSLFVQRLKEELSRSGDRDRGSSAKTLLEFGVLEYFLSAWFLKGEKTEDENAVVQNETEAAPSD